MKLGDYIKFRVALREGMRTATRKITGFYDGKPTVGFNGYRDFIVRPAEILEVLAEGQKR